MLKPIQNFCEKHSGEIVLFGMLVWVVLLVIGTIAETFDIEWILNWPIWRPPGRYE